MRVRGLTENIIYYLTRSMRYVGFKDWWEMDDIAYIISEKIRVFERQVSKLKEKFGLIMSTALYIYNYFNFKLLL